MSKKQTLVNNGLPEGLHFKDIKPGDILLVKWLDSQPLHLVVADNYDGHRPRSYKGLVMFRSLQGHSFEADQVLRKAGSVNDMIESMDKDLSEEERAIRAAE